MGLTAEHRTSSRGLESEKKQFTGRDRQEHSFGFLGVLVVRLGLILFFLVNCGLTASQRYAESILGDLNSKITSSVMSRERRFAKRFLLSFSWGCKLKY